MGGVHKTTNVIGNYVFPSIDTENISISEGIVRVYYSGGYFYKDYKLSDYSDIGALLNQAQSDQAVGSGYGEVGGKILIGQKLYDLTTQIDWLDGVRIVGGSMRASAIKANDSFTGTILDSSPSSDQRMSGLEFLRLDGNKENTSCKGIVTSNANGGDPGDYKFRDVIVADFDKDAVQFDYGWGYHVLDLLVERCGANADVAAVSLGNGDRFRQCYGVNWFIAYNKSNPAFLLVEGEGNNFVNLNIFNNDCIGGQVKWANNKFTGLWVHNNSQADPGTYAGFQISSGANNVEIIGGIFDGGTDELCGLQINGDNNSVTNAIFKDHATRNLDIQGNNNIVSDCQFDGDIRILGDYNQLQNCKGYNSITDNGTANVINGAATEDLGASPTSAPTETYPEGTVVRNSNADNNETWQLVRGTWVQIV